MPDGVDLQQYHHLRQNDVNSILEHWASRQAAGKIPFRFRNMALEIQENESLEEDDIDVDMTPSEGEEVLSDDRDSQTEGDRTSQEDGCNNGSTEQAHPGQNLGNAHSPDDGPGAAGPSTGADAHARQQTGGGMALDSSHAHPLTHSRPYSLNYPHPFPTDGLRTGQPDGASTEDERSGSGSDEREPSPGDVSNFDRLIER